MEAIVVGHVACEACFFCGFACAACSSTRGARPFARRNTGLRLREVGLEFEFELFEYSTIVG